MATRRHPGHPAPVWRGRRRARLSCAATSAALVPGSLRAPSRDRRVVIWKKSATTSTIFCRFDAGAASLQTCSGPLYGPPAPGWHWRHELMSPRCLRPRRIARAGNDQHRYPARRPDEERVVDDFRPIMNTRYTVVVGGLTPEGQCSQRPGFRHRSPP